MLGVSGLFWEERKVDKSREDQKGKKKEGKN